MIPATVRAPRAMESRNTALTRVRTRGHSAAAGQHGDTAFPWSLFLITWIVLFGLYQCMDAPAIWIAGGGDVSAIAQQAQRAEACSGRGSLSHSAPSGLS